MDHSNNQPDSNHTNHLSRLERARQNRLLEQLAEREAAEKAEQERQHTIHMEENAKEQPQVLFMDTPLPEKSLRADLYPLAEEPKPVPAAPAKSESVLSRPEISKPEPIHEPTFVADSSEQPALEAPATADTQPMKDVLASINPYSLLLESQKQFFGRKATIDRSFRRQQLKLLKGIILNRKQDILDALYQDLGKSAEEAYMSEVGLTLSAINWQIRHLNDNTSAKLHLAPIHEFPALSKTVNIPYGNVLIMAPWNYPFLLAMVPLAEAIAAGNTAIVKTGHAATNTSRVIREICEAVFERDYVAVIEGGHEEISALLELKFDYIFFTGGKKLGSIVYEAAAKHMTPVTLELGGKSPAVIDESANLALAAKRIVFGKFLNAGQTCVAPDYVVVHESVKERFLILLEKEIKKQYPNPEDIGRIISEPRYEHLLSLVQPDKVIIGGYASGPTLQIEPTVMDNVSWDDPVMQEEIFGPILPVLTYTDFRSLMKKLADLPTPLAFYLFSRNKLHQRFVEYVQPFGGGCINDTVIQLTSDNLPFGGMGASGMGQYHGKWGFETFSHTKAIVKKAPWPDLPMRYNNRKPWMGKLIELVLH